VVDKFHRGERRKHPPPPGGSVAGLGLTICKAIIGGERRNHPRPNAPRPAGALSPHAAASGLRPADPGQRS